MECSSTINEVGDVSSWSRFTSILFNQKKNISSYIGRHLDDQLTERAMTDEYYDLATDFYEWGWGQSFHFATRFRGETLAQSITRHEHFLASKLGLKAGQRVADLGMGVGGPLRSIVKFTGADVTGVTINDYQVRRALEITARQESDATARLTHYERGDFTKLVPDIFGAESLDAVYYIESACHLSNRTETFLEAARALKPGGRLFTYEWVLTSRFDGGKPEHVAIKEGIEWGNGIEHLVLADDVLRALRDSGLAIVEHGDLAELAAARHGDHDVPWYYDMAQTYAFSSLSAFQLSDFGAGLLSYFLWALAKMGITPKDALDTERMLIKGKKNLVEGGRLRLLTPMYYILAEKPTVAVTDSA